MSLRKKIQSRANLLNGAGMRDICEYNAKNPMSVQPPVLVVLQHYPFGYEIAAISAISSKTGARRACSSSSCKRAKPPPEYLFG